MNYFSHACRINTTIKVIKRSRIHFINNRNLLGIKRLRKATEYISHFKGKYWSERWFKRSIFQMNTSVWTDGDLSYIHVTEWWIKTAIRLHIRVPSTSKYIIIFIRFYLKFNQYRYRFYSIYFNFSRCRIDIINFRGWRRLIFRSILSNSIFDSIFFNAILSYKSVLYDLFSEKYNNNNNIIITIKILETLKRKST